MPRRMFLVTKSVISDSCLTLTFRGVRMYIKNMTVPNSVYKVRVLPCVTEIPIRSDILLQISRERSVSGVAEVFGLRIMGIGR